ncbi:GNAT family N-acetyltransferase [Bacillus sp. H-16]|uniref:GNAT family N-acetyltransferase n=1 Tax=Alteribacter salitolerans TaxID=2912333 RepID=UPI001966C3AB|nr:GNAT family N-acetyltransferase [Alteribacter salitolerans]MBM7096141.1 GNAT family N-acetyltransferase [Alteribacter salitolerans]
MKNTTKVRLTHYHPKYLINLMNFQLPREQAVFTSFPRDMIQVKKGQHRIVIVSDDQPAGFFLLHKSERVKAYTENPEAMLLTGFSIDYKYQGKGVAKSGLLQLKAFMHDAFPDCCEIVLSVNVKNIPAQRLYIKTGFADTGRKITGPVGEQYIYSLSLTQIP